MDPNPTYMGQDWLQEVFEGGVGGPGVRFVTFAKSCHERETAIPQVAGIAAVLWRLNRELGEKKGRQGLVVQGHAPLARQIATVVEDVFADHDPVGEPVGESVPPRPTRRSKPDVRFLGDGVNLCRNGAQQFHVALTRGPEHGRVDALDVKDDAVGLGILPRPAFDLG